MSESGRISSVGIWLFDPAENAVHNYKHGHMDLEVDEQLFYLGARRTGHERAGLEGVLKPVERGNAGELISCSIHQRALAMSADLRARELARFPIGPVRSSRLYTTVEDRQLELLRGFLERTRRKPPLASLMAVDNSHNCATFVVTALLESSIIPYKPKARGNRPYLPKLAFEALEAMTVKDQAIFHREEWALEGTSWQFVGKRKPEEK